MQIRLTVLGPPGGPTAPHGCDLLVTAPPGTPLAAISGALAQAAQAGEGPVVLYAGGDRLDVQRSLLGEPPLIDGAVLSLHGPGPAPVPPDASTRLHVVSGPDAGGVHLLHGGRAGVGRAEDADIALDDPDVSRAHCAVTVVPDGRVLVADLDSTNGTTVDGEPVGRESVPLAPGALLRIGESGLRLADEPPPAVPATADGEGRVRVPTPDAGPVVPFAPGEAAPPAAPAPSTAVERQPDEAPAAPRRRGGLGAWARRFSAPRPTGPATPDPAAPPAPTPRLPDAWPDPAALLLTALGPGPRLWERAQGHPETLTVRLGTADRSVGPGAGPLRAVPVTVSLLEAGSLGLAGPRPRLTGLARAVLAQLTALHAPDRLDLVLVSADRARPVETRTAEWSWLGWLPHVRPARGQDCRLLLAHDPEQAAARTGELLRRLDETLHEQAARRAAGGSVDEAAGGPYTVVVLDGDPGTPELREAAERLAAQGAAAGIHVLCLAETPPASPTSPLTATFETAAGQNPAFRSCGAAALLTGDVATSLRLLRVAGGSPVGQGVPATVDAVSPAWAERFARALAPLRPDTPSAEPHARVTAPLPRTARLLDELGLARATPASLLARWAAAADHPGPPLGPPGCVQAVLGAGRHGPVTVDLAADQGAHLLIEGPPGSGRTELLRALAASLCAAERPERLGLILLDGGDTGGPGAGEGLRSCTELPHVTARLGAHDPGVMREFAQTLAAELKRRAELLAPAAAPTPSVPAPRADRTTAIARDGAAARPGTVSHRALTGETRTAPTSIPTQQHAEVEAPPSRTLRLRTTPGAASEPSAAAPPPRLVVLVDDLDALLAPALGSPGRPSAGSVVRALEAVARDGERLGVHLIATTASMERAAATELARRALLRVTLDTPLGGPEDPAPGRGTLTAPDSELPVPFQAGRVSGRIPRTATLRPTVVALDWSRAGDPPTRRPVRELGNGPTDLALLASALERAASGGR
ncbi:FHA domain-containing protein [Streptomyces sp. BRB081]|uniref:FHA domain-containing protein n=1 Tax=Streptomyces sp. BRB081 TaxID=2769544 RepID=UPI0018ACF7B9|nr:FHA domain-containing protein [Streptomyces sp. BRB081]MBL3804737.1 FHA domain-containing protein [Streptomyces sp. BRB081]